MPSPLAPSVPTVLAADAPAPARTRGCPRLHVLDWASASTLAAWTLTGLAFLAFSWFAVAQHLTFHTRARDMGIYAQVLWNTAQGRPFASTLLQDNGLHIAEHVAPVLALLAPLYALAPTPILLLVVQQACLAGAGLPLFFWSRARLGPAVALVLLLGFYAMPATSRIALSEFHPIVMAALPASLAVKAVLEGKTRAAVAWLILALLFEEETAPLVGAASAYLWLRHRRWSGAALGGLAVVWLLALVLLVMPAFHDRKTLERVDGNRSIAHYEQVQADPNVGLTWLAGERGAHAALWLLAPMAGLSLLAPHVLALAAPSFALLFLADRDGNVAGHWAGAVLPVYWFATGAGLAALTRLAGARRQAARGVGVGLLVVAGALCYWQFSLFPGGDGYDPGDFTWTEQEDDLARAVALAPPDVRLDATRRIVPHLANRAEVYQFPSTFYTAPMRPNLDKIEAFVFDLTDSQTRRALDATDRDTVLTGEPRYHVRVWGDDVLLLTRERPSPSIPIALLYGSTLRLNGYDLERAPGRLRLTVYWEVTARTSARTRIADLLDPDGQIVTRAEAAPLDPYLPPARWNKGQTIAEAIDLPLPPDAPTGPYTIRLTWLDKAGQPLPFEGGDGTVSIP
ncbi:MAG: DUF2079 domain-containing protein [Chloroflexi bacterium]|nr:DUF2079 domain-containing protein [Chloroflexota bacterium]